ncbi:splicing regulatory glutamine/lysine-rich protein 1-like isoform X4 [Mizuhopecten yessoensis]|uniref:splicing regulatory glutamine/lysine-rich protein 1-like isoform X4 n=1 Tax=Mizuhopecten yessoensis TaxID=6573 RepID=UPI000B45E781|nr:splicing regulatory glutamine/lysine-rich protein 1-like isoform X4 [Mizuhopecten yessoensis]
MSSEKINTRVIQVTNVAPAASKDQMKTLFGYIGRIDEIKLYPPEAILPDPEDPMMQTESHVTPKVCYVKFDDVTSTGVAMHLTNTVFIDRALIIVPVMDGKIPEESVALQLAPSAIAGMMPGQPTWPSNVMSQMTGIGSGQIITTYDPRMTALGLSQYPPLPGTTDPTKIEEIRRTVYIGNLDQTVAADQLLKFFSQVGEIKYVRMAGDESMLSRFAFVEFTDQRSVATALTYNGVVFQGRPITVGHATNAISKPITKTQQAAQREIEEAMKKVKEAQSLITAAVDDKGRDRSRSRSTKRYRSRSRSRRRSRSKSRKRDRSRKRSKSKKRSRSRSRKRSRSRRSRSRKRSRSRSRTRKRSRKRSRDKSRHRSRSKSKTRSKRSRSRSRSKEGTAKISKQGSTEKSKQGSTEKSTDEKGKNYFPTRRKSRTPPRAYSRRSRSRSRRRSRTPKRSRSIEKKKSLSPPKLEREDNKPGKQKDGTEAPPALTDSPTEVASTTKPGNSPSQPSDEVKTEPKHRSSSETRSKSRSPVRKASTSPRRVSHSPRKVSRSPPPRKVSRSPVKRSSRSPRRSPRRSSRSPRRIRRSRSRSRSRGKKVSKRNRRSRSTSRRRSRSTSRHKSRKDKKRDRSQNRDRDRDRDRDREGKKKRHKDKDKERDRDDKHKESKAKDTKVIRNYDEEEKLLENSNSDSEEKPVKSTPSDSNLQPVDMDMSD